MGSVQARRRPVSRPHRVRGDTQPRLPAPRLPQTHLGSLRGERGTQVLRLQLLLCHLVQRAVELCLAAVERLAQVANLQLSLIGHAQHAAKLLGIGKGQPLGSRVVRLQVLDDARLALALALGWVGIGGMGERQGRGPRLDLYLPLQSLQSRLRLPLHAWRLKKGGI